MYELQQLFKGYTLNLSFLGYALCILIACDLITGILKGYLKEGVLSSKLRDGGFKKCGVLIVVALSRALGILLSDTACVLSNSVMAYYVYTELVSVFENLDAIGIELPPVLKQIFGRAKR